MRAVIRMNRRTSTGLPNRVYPFFSVSFAAALFPVRVPLAVDFPAAVPAIAPVPGTVEQPAAVPGSLMITNSLLTEGDLVRVTKPRSNHVELLGEARPGRRDAHQEDYAAQMLP